MEKEEFAPKHYSILSDVIYFIRYFKRYEPIVLLCCVVEIILGAVNPFFLIYLPKLALDLAEGEASMEKAVLLLGGLVLLTMVTGGTYGMVNFGKYYYYNDQRVNFLGLIFLKSLRIPYGYTESGAIKKIYWKAYNTLANGDFSASSQMVQGTVGLLKNVLCFLLYSTVLGTLSIWMLLAIILISFLNYLIGMHQIQYEESLREEYAEANKRWNCVRAAMGNTQGAKDIRIFGMKPWLVQLRDMSIADICKVKRKSSKRKSLYEKLEFLLSAIRDLGAYGYLLYQAVNGMLTAGEFVLYFGAVTGFSGFVISIMDSILYLRSAANSTDYVRTYMELPEEDRTTGSRHIGELDGAVEIEFRNVSFAYRDSGEAGEEGEAASAGKKIFEHLNLTIHAGEKIALVGINGAGKTTLVKLLCGMYEPDEGEIFINGIDRREFPKLEYYKLFSVVFQEQLIFPFTVGENIALQKAERVDEEKAWDALEKAGLKEVFEEKKIGMKSYMTKVMTKDGIELSGGQQQSFLLARALYKDAPVLVLDEPTAALDPIAESGVYENYNKYSEGKTAVFISHRLASTRFSDRIAMIENGKILEMGTHEELMRRDGAYAKMFRIQSSYYNNPSPDALQEEYMEGGTADA